MAKPTAECLLCEEVREEFRKENPHWIADLRVSTAFVARNQVCRGYVVLIYNKAHATELYHLKRDDRIAFMDDLVDIAAKANFKSLGPRLGPTVKAVAPAIAALGAAEIRELEAGATRELSVDGGSVTISFEDVVLTRNEKEELIVENSGTLTVALDTHLTPELIAEGLAREFVNKVQNMRKDADFEITDRITVTWYGDEDVTAALAANHDYVAGEILADAIDRIDAPPEGGTAWELNGHDVVIAITLVRR